MRIRVLISLLFLALPGAAHAQQALVSGRVTGPAGQPLSAVQVVERGTQNGTLTGADGRYEIRVRGPDAVLRFALIGHGAVERAVGGRSVIDVTLAEQGVVLEGLTVVGTRRKDRSALQTPVAVDVIDLTAVATATGQLEINQILQYVAPSFNATRQSGADGSDHIDPATLRGLGPDQTLVLINGKRRHQSSLINIFGSRGRGNTGTDLNAIPVAAIERIEILRDGASAQYGSDAIAGVINIVLKSRTDELSASATTGAHYARPPSAYAVSGDQSMDGEQLQASANYGMPIGDGGFLNATAEVLTREHTNRPADPAQWDVYRRQFGDAAGRGIGTFLNTRLPLSENVAFYAFGGLSLRDTDAYAWSRNPGEARNVEAIYPNGFDPVIEAAIQDGSISAGLATRLGGWSIDFNNTFGYNRLHYGVSETLNASLQEMSPTSFDAGGFSFGQNTTGVQATQLFPGVMAGLNAAFGAEFRIDRYSIFAGEEASWKNYGPIYKEVDGEQELVPGGSQGFPGFQPANELTEHRTNFGAYADAELDLTRSFLVGVAARFENYSDFGSTLNGKVASRLALSDAFALRGSVSTGFRAPSLAQIYFNSTFTDFVAGSPVDKQIANNADPLARALGIPELREERAVNGSAGFTARLGDFSATVDGYLVDVEDRIVLTGAFTDDDPDVGAELQSRNVGAVQFFTNALDTRTHGLDVVLGYSRVFGGHDVRATLAGNFNEIELGAIHTSPKLAGKEETYFGSREQYFLEASAPRRKMTFGLDHGLGDLRTALRLNHFGRVVLADWLHEPDAPSLDVYEPKTTTDLSFGYRASPRMMLTVGGTNIFNVYPTQQDTETETGGLWDAVQMGSSGAFFFARANVTVPR
jgi:iron complex outermembrane receptor protein